METKSAFNASDVLKYYFENNCLPDKQDSIIFKTDQHHPLYKGEHCYILHTKKPKYYVHKYESSGIIDSIKNINIEINIEPKADSLTRYILNKLYIAYNQEQLLDLHIAESKSSYLHNIEKIFDLEPLNNCCNCISLCFYDGELKDNIFIKYLLSMKRTVENVMENLPDWIVRLYFHPNVFERAIKDPICWKVLSFMTDINNTEIYIHFCEYVDISHARMLRFLPLIDKKVNCVTVREADGFVTNLDCRNIERFSKKNAIIYRLATNIIKNDGFSAKLHGYKPWLTSYKRCYEPDSWFKKNYFSQNNNIFELLAGTISCNLKLKSEIFYDNIDHIKKWMLSSDDYSFHYALDEIILLHTFRDIISVPYVGKYCGYDKVKEQIVKNHNIYRDNHVYHIGMSYGGCIAELKKLDIFKPDFWPEIKSYLSKVKIEHYCHESNVNNRGQISVDTILKRKYLNQNNENFISLGFYYLYGEVCR